jgi:uncharacterized protein (UPF0335 family)
VQAARNTLDAKAKPFLDRIEHEFDELASLRGKYMADAKVIREDIKSIYAEAKDAGVTVTPLRALVQWRELERKQEALATDMDIDERAAYDQLVETLGPLGAAAKKAAGFSEEQPANDPKKSHPPTEAELATLGRGPRPDAGAGPH